MIALGISSKFNIEQVEDLYEGISLACKNYAVDLAGGDITSSLTGMTIGVTAVGKVEQIILLKRWRQSQRPDMCNRRFRCFIHGSPAS